MRKNIIFGLLMAGFVTGLQAQESFVGHATTNSYDVFDHNGKAFVNSETDISGSPFFRDDWTLGTLVLIDNRKYDSVKFRLNVQTQEIHFLNKDNTEFALDKGYIKQARWRQAIGDTQNEIRFQCGFPAIDAQDGTNFYEVVCQGRIQLLRSVRKIIVRRKDVVSGEVRKEYVTYEDFYAFDGKTMQRVKKDKSFVTALLADKKELITSFAEKNNLKFKSVDDLKRTIDYYNSL
jgi:hypothetical protein